MILPYQADYSYCGKHLIIDMVSILNQRRNLGGKVPELPEVETVMRGLAPALEGQTIASAEIRRPNLRFPFPDKFTDRLANKKILHLERRAKYILAYLDDDSIWLSHLGMTGRFSVFVDGQKGQNLAEFYYQDGTNEAGNGKHDHFMMTLSNGTKVVYTDPRRFGIMDLFDASEVQSHKLLANIGVEPLGNSLNAAYLAEQFMTKKAPLKSALLDQKYIAGLGNIYVCEALYRARLSPLAKASVLATRGKENEKGEVLVRKIRDCLSEAIKAGGSTLKDYAGADGVEGSFQQRFDVYDRENEPCKTPDCKGMIKRIVQSGRSTFYCPKCQK